MKKIMILLFNLFFPSPSGDNIEPKKSDLVVFYVCFFTAILFILLFAVFQ